ncbi:MAG: pyridoxal phosphate-dependent aminotransferase [Kiritimatiellia bacterium]
MTLSLSKRAADISQAEIRVMTIECEKAGGINLAQGVCDTGVPPPVSAGAKRAMDDGYNSYTRYDGLPQLREAIARKMLSYNKITANPENEVVVSAGSTGALYCACLALLNPGDEVILFEPFYGYHINTILAVEAVPRYVNMRPPDWTFTDADLERAVTPRTKAILICTPANPSGKVWTAAELEKVAAFARRHDIFIFTDEIYEYFVYDGRKHISPGSLASVADRTITISGYSKTYSITGWRIGYCVCRRQWADMIGYVNDLVYVCAPAPLQLGVAAGIDGLPPSFYSGLCEEFDRKRDLICSTLAGIGLKPYVPQGAYYVMADVSNLPGRTSKEKAMFLLSKTGVASVPGSAFYHDNGGENLVRFCYAKTDEELDKACARLRRLK